MRRLVQGFALARESREQKKGEDMRGTSHGGLALCENTSKSLETASLEQRKAGLRCQQVLFRHVLFRVFGFLLLVHIHQPLILPDRPIEHVVTLKPLSVEEAIE